MKQWGEAIIVEEKIVKGIAVEMEGRPDIKTERENKNERGIDKDC